MKAELEFIENYERSFTIKKIIRKNRPILSKAWHYHPEIELCLTLKSSGKRFIGNNISNYFKDDLVLIGKNIPHGFTTNLFSEQIVIQFKQNAFGETFFDKPELRKIKYILNQAKLGLYYYGDTLKKAKENIIELAEETKPMAKFLGLLNILNILSSSLDFKKICEQDYVYKSFNKNNTKIEKIYTYIMDNYQQKMYVKEMSENLNLTESAFYKFIKKNTNKTFTEIVNEFRLNHATKLLVSTDKNISTICFESGFNNMSYFNRCFKSKIGLTPVKYRNQNSLV